MEIHERSTVELTSEEKNLLKKAGASPEFIQMVSFNITTMDRKRSDGKPVYRHSTLEEAAKYVRGTNHTSPSLTEENARSFDPYGGDFFQKMWDGQLFDAYRRADPNNAAIMLELFGTKRINEHKPPRFRPVTA